MASHPRTALRALRKVKVSKHTRSSADSVLTIHIGYQLPPYSAPYVSYGIRLGPKNLTFFAEQGFATSAEPSLKDTLAKVIPAKRELLKQVKSHATKNIGSVKVENTLGGMR